MVSWLSFTTFTVPLLPGVFGSAAAGVVSANAKRKRLARIIKRPTALRISQCSAFLARATGRNCREHEQAGIRIGPRSVTRCARLRKDSMKAGNHLRCRDLFV